MNNKQIGSTIAYTLRDVGFTPEQRQLIANVFADDLRLSGKRRESFLNECRTYSEQQEHDERIAEVDSWAASVGLTR